MATYEHDLKDGVKNIEILRGKLSSIDEYVLEESNGMEGKYSLEYLVAIENNAGACVYRYDGQPSKEIYDKKNKYINFFVSPLGKITYIPSYFKNDVIRSRAMKFVMKKFAMKEFIKKGLVKIFRRFAYVYTMVPIYMAVTLFFWEGVSLIDKLKVMCSVSLDIGFFVLMAALLSVIIVDLIIVPVQNKISTYRLYKLIRKSKEQESNALFRHKQDFLFNNNKTL
ncbi:hypothetical protein [Citrobacter koseri]|uniref:hypothetical protein n=1 Tax=Citrobacter koseri TaxID=545 RepID=UPI003891D117